MKVLLFDLDDTLYPEIQFVRSGFKAVSIFLGERMGKEPDDIFDRMMEIFKAHGRGKVFDLLLHQVNLNNHDLIRLLVYTYRTHEPELSPFPGCVPTLEKLARAGYRLGLITNGRAAVQRNKVEALGIKPIFELIIYTDELGDNREFWKPSPVPYTVAREFFQVPPGEMVYIGDDPKIDFPGARACGMNVMHVTNDTRKSSIGQDTDRVLESINALPSALETRHDERTYSNW